MASPGQPGPDVSGGNTPDRTRYTFKGRSRGRYVWTSDNGDVCCGIKYFWQPDKTPFRLSLTTRQRVNVLSRALWEAPETGNVYARATSVDETLESMGYILLKRRKV